MGINIFMIFSPFNQIIKNKAKYMVTARMLKFLKECVWLQHIYLNYNNYVSPFYLHELHALSQILHRCSFN